MRILSKGLFVSCQPAIGDETFYDFEMIKRFALAAAYGDAKALRIEGVENVKKIIKIVNIPTIALVKKQSKNYFDKRNITSTYGEALELYKVGAQIIAIDFTFRESCDKKYYENLMKKIRREMENIEIFADISTIGEAVMAEQCGVDYVSCALTGYTEETKNLRIPDFNILNEMKNKINIPFIAEGGFATEQDIELAQDNDAYGVVVGTAITRPHIITLKLSKKWSNYVR